jgi:hypothetical protein
MLDPSAPAGLAWVDLTAQVLGTAPMARAWHSMTSVGELLYVFGGWSGLTGKLPQRLVLDYLCSVL